MFYVVKFSNICCLVDHCFPNFCQGPFPKIAGKSSIRVLAACHDKHPLGNGVRYNNGHTCNIKLCLIQDFIRVCHNVWLLCAKLSNRVKEEMIPTQPVPKLYLVFCIKIIKKQSN